MQTNKTSYLGSILLFTLKVWSCKFEIKHNFFSPQQTFTFSKLTAEALENLLKHVQSKQERYQTSLRLFLYLYCSFWIRFAPFSSNVSFFSLNRQIFTATASERCICNLVSNFESFKKRTSFKFKLSVFLNICKQHNFLITRQVNFWKLPFFTFSPKSKCGRCWTNTCSRSTIKTSD